MNNFLSYLEIIADASNSLDESLDWKQDVYIARDVSPFVVSGAGFDTGCFQGVK